MVAWAGIEPATHGFSVHCSTNWATEPQMAVPTRLELAISSVTDWHVNHYTMEPLIGCGRRTWTYDLRVMSPVSYQLLHPAIKNGGERGIRTPAAVTPCRFSRPIPSARLGYFSVCYYLVDPAGLEPATNRLWAGSSNQLSYGSLSLRNGSGGGTWTPDLPGMNRTL